MNRVSLNLPFVIDAPLEFLSFGEWGYNVIYLPGELIAELPLKEFPRLRIRGMLGRAAFAGAWQPSRGTWYLIVSKNLMAKSGYEPGDIVQLRFRVDDQDAVDIPEVLEEALELDKKAKKAWAEATPGKRRGLAYLVSSAKTYPTQVKRAQEVVAILQGEKEMFRTERKKL